jgi:hypothetical protein
MTILSSDIEVLLVAATTQVRNRGVFTAVVQLLHYTSDDELAAGISQPTLAYRAGITDRSVRRAMVHLCALGVVTKTTLERRITGYVVDRDRLAIVATTLGM